MYLMLLTKCDQSLLQLADELVACVQTFLQSDVLIREVGHTPLQVIYFVFYVGDGGGEGHGEC